MRLPSLLRLSPTLPSRRSSFQSAASSLKLSETFDTDNNDDSTYTPPAVWTWENPDTEAVNRRCARFEQKLQVGKHPLQLYSLATPNGQKVTILLEELLAAGVKEAEYDAWLINIMEKDHFGSEFVKINPNSKIPALVDYSQDTPVKIFESGSILLYLAEKHGLFLPSDLHQRTQVLNWLFWQVGSAPYLGGGFGHFYSYAAEKQKYPIDRFAMETKRQLDVLNRHLADNKYMVGDEYTIADIAIWPWYGGLVLGRHYDDAAQFLSVHEYPHVIRWAQEIDARPAVQRGRMVNRVFGNDKSQQLSERHDASDFEAKTVDKLEAVAAKETLDK